MQQAGQSNYPETYKGCNTSNLTKVDNVSSFSKQLTAVQGRGPSKFTQKMQNVKFIQSFSKKRDSKEDDALSENSAFEDEQQERQSMRSSKSGILL